MSKETFYFSHDYNARNDVKIKRLIAAHGYEGYGIFWSLVEDLYQNANALPLDFECIAYDLRSNYETIKSIVCDFNLFEIGEDTFSSLSVERRLDKRNERSRKARESAMKRWGDKKDKSAQKCERIAIKESKVKESKVKESKVKESKVNSIVDTSVSMSDVAHPTQEKINYQSLIQFFNDETQGVFGTVRTPLSKKRRGSIRARVKDFGVAGFEEMVRKAYRSDFLKGNGKQGFVASFDWMIRPNNFQKIIEGNYDNQLKKQNGSDGAGGDEEFMLHIRQGIARGIEENQLE